MPPESILAPASREAPKPRRSTATRLLRAGRLSLVLEPRDVWVGFYAGPDAFYICLIPCLPVRWARKRAT